MLEYVFGCITRARSRAFQGPCSLGSITRSVVWGRVGSGYSWTHSGLGFRASGPDRKGLGGDDLVAQLGFGAWGLEGLGSRGVRGLWTLSGAKSTSPFTNVYFPCMQNDE